jgi:uncharacterized membrane protein
LLLKVHAERVLAQKAHRELFESRTGYAFRLALKGEKDTQAMVDRIAELTKRKAELLEQEAEYHKKCAEFENVCSEQLKDDERTCQVELNHLKKEALTKKNQLEALIAPVKKNL